MWAEPRRRNTASAAHTPPASLRSRLVDLQDLHESDRTRVEELLVARVHDAPDDLREPRVALLVGRVAVHRDGLGQRQHALGQPLPHKHVSHVDAETPELGLG